MSKSASPAPVSQCDGPGAPAAGSPTEPLDFAALYDTWFEHVTRWLRALGAPVADVEDLAQDVFLVVRRRLPDFDGRNVTGWLYRIASRQVWQHRRRRWVQKVFGSRPALNVEDLPDRHAGAHSILETKQKREQLEAVVARMSDKRRVVFMLFEVEGYTGEEIAEALDVPVNTVWTRLHHARKDFFALLAQRERSTRVV